MAQLFPPLRIPLVTFWARIKAVLFTEGCSLSPPRGSLSSKEHFLSLTSPFHCLEITKQASGGFFFFFFEGIPQAEFPAPAGRGEGELDPSLCTACSHSLLHTGESFPVTNRNRKVTGVCTKIKASSWYFVFFFAHWSLTPRARRFVIFWPDIKWHPHCCCHSFLADRYCHHYTLEIFLPSDDSGQKAKLLATGLQEFPFKTLLGQGWPDSAAQSQCLPMQ